MTPKSHRDQSRAQIACVCVPNFQSKNVGMGQIERAGVVCFSIVCSGAIKIDKSRQVLARVRIQ